MPAPSSSKPAPGFEQRRWLHPAHRKLKHTPVFATADEMLAIAWAYFGPRWLAGCPRILYPSDTEYYCPPVDEALGIATNSRVDHEKYADGGFDCDDFAYVLKGHFCEAAFVDGARRFPYCFGILWAGQPSHALNWMINDDGLLRLVEPQRGEVVPLDNFHNLYLAMI
jgi:hypothetical protein